MNSEIIYYPVDLDAVCQFYAKRLFKKELSYMDVYVDVGKRKAIFELVREKEK
jgi:hypothetical protein